MRLIPVIDLLDAQVVHAVRGERSHYKPIKSLLCQTADPLDVAAAFRDRLGLAELYVADLNAIQGIPLASNRELIHSLIHREKLRIILDAGVADVENARAWLDSGIHKVVVGAETLQDSDDLRRISDDLDPRKLIFSLDMRFGKILSRCPEIGSLSAIELLRRLQAGGWREVILLDLDKVGSKEGVDFSLVSETLAAFPDLSILVGGGVSRIEELCKLKNMGIAGVLMATAFHRGAITAQHIVGFNRVRPKSSQKP